MLVMKIVEALLFNLIAASLIAVILGFAFFFSEVMRII